MIRVIIDTQSNPFFRGIPMEQDYDQRGGLCQVGEGNIVVTTNPIDPNYLDYWKELGFTLPQFVVAGPFDPQLTLAELILGKPEVKKEISKLIRDRPARLEFFCIEDTEEELAKALDIPGYCNFDVSTCLSRKIPFKQVCKSLSLSTPSWFFGEKTDDLFAKAKELLEIGKPILFKANVGTGGISCGSAYKIDNVVDLDNFNLNSDMQWFIEVVIVQVVKEVSIHWEINENGDLIIIGIFGQLANNFSYAGTYYPVNISDILYNQIVVQLKEKLGPHLINLGAKGYFCCDIIISKEEIPFWIDFNPRKGAILYIWSMTKRLSEIRFDSNLCYFWHKHIPIKEKGCSFNKIKKRLGELLAPSKDRPFVVITNPAVIKYGYIDITGISLQSLNVAKEVFQRAVSQLTS